MRPDEGATQVPSIGFQAVRCFLCRRICPAETPDHAAVEWDEFPGVRHDYCFRLAEVVAADTYCEECAVFYHQLLTYGHPGQGLGGWGTHVLSTT